MEKEFPYLGTICRPPRDNRDAMIHGLAGRMLLNELTPASIIIARMIPNPPGWVEIIAKSKKPLAERRIEALEYFYLYGNATKTEV